MKPRLTSPAPLPLSLSPGVAAINAGTGFAKAAEHNTYPGPMHTPELKERLGLTPEQMAPLGTEQLKRHGALRGYANVSSPEPTHGHHKY